jgi:hypothetical protein
VGGGGADADDVLASIYVRTLPCKAGLHDIMIEWE